MNERMDGAGGATLSLCMIVKNEAKFLPGCLESLRDVCDQMIVVDTGSTDDTVAIARRHGAEVHTFAWCDDFAAARNASIEPATGDWILWVDADERLTPASVAELRNLLVQEARPVIYQVRISSIVHGGSDRHLSTAHRLFTNGRGIRFSGRIHEQISPSAATVGAEERHCRVLLDHLGYDDRDAELQSSKGARNRRLLERMAKENPRSAYAHYTLGQHYSLSGEHRKALRSLESARRLKQFDTPMTAAMLNSMGEIHLKLENVAEARRMAEESRRLLPRQVGAYYLLYRVAVAGGEDDRALSALERLLERNALLERSGTDLSTDVVIDPLKIHYEMGMILQRMERSEEALMHFERVLRVHPGEASVLERVVSIYLKGGRLAEAERHLQALVRLDDGNSGYGDLLGTVLIKQSKFGEAISVYERLVEARPDNVAGVKRLAGLYAKVGDLDKARGLLAVLNG